LALGSYAVRSIIYSSTITAVLLTLSNPFEKILEILESKILWSLWENIPSLGGAWRNIRYFQAEE